MGVRGRGTICIWERGGGVRFASGRERGVGRFVFGREGEGDFCAFEREGEGGRFGFRRTQMRASWSGATKIAIMHAKHSSLCKDKKISLLQVLAKG